MRRRLGFDPWVGKIPPEKEMATHSSILAWEMPRTEEPDGPQSMGRIKVGLNPQLRTEVIPKTTLKCVCVCVCLYLLLPSWSLSRNLHVFLPLYLLTASRRPVRLAPASPRRSGSG